MTRLAPLHARLSAILRRRRLSRLARAYGAVALIALVSLWALFVLDWSFSWERGTRLVGLTLAVGVMVLAVRRLLAPAITVRETETDIALWIESRQQLDSDLVAAIQFEPPSAAAWGSRPLELAIVEYVADFSETMRVAPQRPSRAVVAGGVLLAFVVAASANCFVTHPGHAAAFVDRLLLGTSHYPTRTRIVSLAINGQRIEHLPATQKCAAGEALRIEVHCEGESPAAGRAVFTATSGGESTTIELVESSTEFIPSSVVQASRLPHGADGANPVGAPPQSASAVQGAEPTAHYVGELPRLVDSVECQVVLGDVRSERVSLVVAPLPVLSVSLRLRPPDYAASDEPREGALAGATQISVLEGSRVELEVVSKNKPLERATLHAGERQFKLQPADVSRRRWWLNLAGTPLEHVTDTLRFSIRATDADGLELPEPLSGLISLSVDQPPRVVATAVTHDLLPTARPTIHYSARDDYGLAELRMRRELLRPGEPAREEVLEIPLGQSPRKAIEGTLTLELREFRAVKGDLFRVTIEATDFRGPGEGKSAASEPLVLRVTDARGILAGMTETDERSAEELDRIIEQQLGAEDEP